MPGVNVTTITRTGPTAPNLAPAGQLFLAGLAERGSTTTPVRIRGLADFETYFGGRVAYSQLYETVQTFFEEGGSQAYMVRVVGPSATLGSVTVPDRASPAVDTIDFEAKNAGAWSSGLTVTVNDLTGGLVEFVVALDGDNVERYVASDIDGLIRAFEDSIHVSATSLGSASTAPDNMPAEGTYTLSAGADDRANVSATEYEEALDLYTLTYGNGAVAIPGVGTSVHSALITHANTHRRVALLSAGENATPTELKTIAENQNSEYAGLFAPWIQIATPVGPQFISPEGYVAAMRNRAHVDAGPWRAPAGQIAVARSVIGLKEEYNRNTGDDLDANKVSAIRVINNTVRLYGWRSLSDDTANYSLLLGRDVLNYLVWQSEAFLEQYVFRTVDGKGQLLSAINGTIVGILEPIRQAGGLYERIDENGDLIDPGYLVETGSTVNSLTNLANNEVKARISVRVSPAAALISVTIVKVGLLANL